MSLNNFLTNPKTETRATKTLCCEERLEGFCRSFWRHSWTIVCDRQEDAISPSSVVSLSTAKDQASAGGMHCIYRVPNQITQYLANLSFKAMDRALVGTPFFHPNIRIQDAALKDRKDGVHQRIAGYFGGARRLFVKT